MKKSLFLFLGCVTFTLGTIGIFVPFLPTTGFYLATSFFWLRSSEARYQRFIRSKYYQTYIVEILVEKNISTKRLIRMLVMMGIIFGLSISLVSAPGLKWLLVFIYLAHVVGLTWYLKWQPQRVKLKQIKKDLGNS